MRFDNMPSIANFPSRSASGRVLSLLRRRASRGLRGFTLVELIVVITILAILALIGFLALSGYTTDASNAAVKSNLRTLVTAIGSESALGSVSMRKFVVHDGARAVSGTVLSGAVALVPGAAGTAGTNYSAGKFDFPFLNVDASKYSGGDDDYVAGAADAQETLPSGMVRVRSQYQAAATVLEGESRVPYVEGNYVRLSGADVEGLILSSGGGPIVEGLPGGAVSESGWTTCADVDNAVGNDGDVSTCLDDRTYAHVDASAVHDRTYPLVKVAGKWWFNRNLGYPLSDASKYRGSGDWVGALWNISVVNDLWLYSCPWIDSTSNVDCSLLQTYGYFYQWSAIMNGESSIGWSPYAQGICPAGWRLPVKSDFQTTAWSLGQPANWNRTLAGIRSRGAVGTMYYDQEEYIMTSGLGSPTYVDYMYFWKTTNPFLDGYSLDWGMSTRCIKKD